MLFTFALSTFFLVGCAHRSVTPPALSSDPTMVSPFSQNQDIYSSKGTPSDLEEENDFFDEFEEEYEDKSVCVADPLAPWNRAMFHFNDKLYFWILKPAARGYKAVTPRLLRVGVKNFFQNITTPARLVSCILQAKWQAAGGEFVRFLFNSTVGVVGLGNPAKKYPQLNPEEEDLGQTLGVYGIGNGFYLVWPFLGPSTLRDSVGMAGDMFLNPVTYIEPTEVSLGITGFKMLNETSFRIGDYEAFKDAAIEPYGAMLDAYVQHRKQKVEE